MAKKQGMQARRRRGAVTVEYAFALPLVLLFFFTMIEFSRAAMLKHAANNAAYEAARVGVTPGATVEQMRQRAQQVLGGSSIGIYEINVTPTFITDDVIRVSVGVTVPYGGNAWMAPKWLKGGRFESNCTLEREDF